ncbi:MAG: hypothetical protein ABR962_04640 [Candidatus Bathyarchaeia archaeon]|jgi:hypothetical protein
MAKVAKPTGFHVAIVVEIGFRDEVDRALPKCSAILAFIPLLSDTGTITVAFYVSPDRRLRKSTGMGLLKFLGIKRMSNQKCSECELTLRKESWKGKTEKENG